MFACQSYTSGVFDNAASGLGFHNDTRELLSGDLDAGCNDPDVLMWKLLAGVPMLLFYAAGVPLALYVLLRRHVRNRGTKVSSHTRIKLGFLFSR